MDLRQHLREILLVGRDARLVVDLRQLLREVLREVLLVGRDARPGVDLPVDNRLLDAGVHNRLPRDDLRARHDTLLAPLLHRVLQVCRDAAAAAFNTAT